MFRSSEHSQEAPVAGDVLRSLAEITNLCPGVARGQVLEMP